MSQLPPRPGGVIASGVLLFVYGGLMLICSACGVFGMLVGDQEMEAAIAKEAPAYQFLNITQAISNVIIGIGMIILGVLVMQLRPWGRYLAYAACIYEILSLIVHSVHQVVFVYPVIDKMLEDQAKNNAPGMGDFGDFVLAMFWMNLLISVLLTLGICGTIIILLSGPRVRAAFTDEFDSPDAPRTRRWRDHGDFDDDDYPPYRGRSDDFGFRE